MFKPAAPVAAPLPMATSSHFCPHGNLRYSCAKCRDERRAARAPPKRQTYGRPLGPGGKIPPKSWNFDGALRPHEQTAVQAAAGKSGVVVMPAVLGLRRVAFALLRSLRHDAETILFIAPSARAAESWSETLATDLHVPPEEIDDSGRAVRDWERLAPLVIWAPETAMRNQSGLRQNAQRLALFVDSPDAEAYASLDRILALPFKRRIGVTAARHTPPEPRVWPRLDALGGIIHHLGVRDAIRQGLLRDPHHRYRTLPGAHPDAKAIATAVRSAVEESTRTGHALVVVDDSATARAVEETLSQGGITARAVTGAATPELAQRAARAVREGAARVLIRTPDAPPTPTGPVAAVIHAASHSSPTRTAQGDLNALALGEGRLHIFDLLPSDAPDDATARRHALRAMDVRYVYGTAIPPHPWLLGAAPVPTLDATHQSAVEERAADGWHAVLGHLPEILADGWSENDAVAALADTYLAVRTDTAPFPLGPSPTEPGLLVAADSGPGLAGMALVLPEARPVFGTLLANDLPAYLATYAASPMVHHLAPDPRALAVATLETIRTSGIPSLDPSDPHAAADLLLRRGAALPSPERFEAGPPPSPLNAEPHMERMLQALEAEKTLETEESVDEIARLSPEERQRQGRTLLGLELVGKQRTASGLGLRYARPAARGGARPPLPYTELSPGALVDLSPGIDYDPLGRGTVSSLDAYEVTVLVEEDRERRAPGLDTRIDMVGNPRIYDLLGRSVRLVYGPGGLSPGSGAGGLKDHLLERATPHNPERVKLQSFNARLDPSQRRAVAAALGAPALTLIHGPPGTGKTTTLVELLLQETARGHRVLVTADSNAAVDTVMDAYLQAGGIGVRTGPRPSLTRGHLAPFHIDNVSARAPGIDWLQRAPVVFTTHVSSASLPRELTFDLVVQDEASQATEPASCASLVRAPRLVLAGDHLQLPPVVRAPEAEALGLKVSLFERLHTAYGDTLGHLLSVQYRMHPDIEAWSNAEFYEGRIETAVAPPAISAAVRAGLLPESPRALFAHVAGAENAQRTSKEREPEARWIADRVQALLDAGVRPGDIAVIAAYRAQVRLLRRLMDGMGVDIGTIDAFQGSERDLVLVSLVRGNPKGEVGFVREPRRLNVAMTRARKHLIVVGHGPTLEGEPILRRLIAHLSPYPETDRA